MRKACILRPGAPRCRGSWGTLRKPNLAILSRSIDDFDTQISQTIAYFPYDAQWQGFCLNHVQPRISFFLFSLYVHLGDALQWPQTMTIPL